MLYAGSVDYSALSGCNGAAHRAFFCAYAHAAAHRGIGLPERRVGALPYLSFRCLPEPSPFLPVYHEDSNPTRGGIAMPTVLNKSLKRELTIKGDQYVLTISPESFKIVPKGKRKGQEIMWSAIVNGEAALATALNASLKYGSEDSDHERASRAGAQQREHE
jgi:hypothetical protein